MSVPGPSLQPPQPKKIPNISYFAVLYFLVLIEVLCMSVYAHKVSMKWHFWITVLLINFGVIVFAYFIDEWMGETERFRFEQSPDRIICGMAQALPNTGDKIYKRPAQCCAKDKTGFTGYHEMTPNNFQYRPDSGCSSGNSKSKYADTITPQTNCNYEPSKVVENYGDNDLVSKLKDLNVDFYYGDYCGHCQTMKKMLKEAGAEKAVNYKDTSKINLPKGVLGVPHSVSNKTGKTVTGARNSLKELVDALSVNEGYAGSNDLKQKLKELDIDIYYSPACGYCKMLLKSLEEKGVKDVVNLKNTSNNKLPVGVEGVPYSSSNVTKKTATGYMDLEKLVEKLSGSENFEYLKGDEACCDDYYKYDQYLVPGKEVHESLAGGNPNYCNSNCSLKNPGRKNSGILGV